jgi:Ni,Fe-hydrogenase III large subunit
MDKKRKPGKKQLDLFPTEGIDWSRVEEAKRVWLPDAGGNQGARLEFLSAQGLRLIMADRGPEGRGTLHFHNPKDGETIHLGAVDGEGLLHEAERYFPEAERWVELIRGKAIGDAKPSAAVFLDRDGLLLEAGGGRVHRVYEISREYPQGALYGSRARQACTLLESDGGMEGNARTIAFIQALEEARGIKAPVAALALRAALLEVNRACGHLAWLSKTADLLGRPGTSRRCANLLQGLRHMMGEWLDDPNGGGWCLPGGLREDFPLQGAAEMAGQLASAAADWEKASRAMGSLPVPGWLERRLKPLSRDVGKNGWVGPLALAAGLHVDARVEEPGVYTVLGRIGVKPPRAGGILKRMVIIRTAEVRWSLEIARCILENLPEGSLLVKRGRGGRGEGFGRCEGLEGQVCCHVVLDKGRVSYLAFSLPRELNRSASRSLIGAWLDEVDIISLLWGQPPASNMNLSHI